MSFFENFGKKVTEAGQKTLQKTKDLTDTSKLNSLVGDAEKKIQSTYTEIGKVYVSLHRTDCEEAFQDLIATIIKEEEEIQRCKKQIREIKGVRTCPNCNAEVNADAAFCSSCGTPLPKEVVEEPNVIRCENCGSEIGEDMLFCTNCGKAVNRTEESVEEESVEEENAVQTEKVCEQCGAKMAADLKFCTNCGKALDE